MAGDPKARLVTVSYQGGTMTASLGLLEYLLGPLKLSWKAPGGGTSASGARKRKYGAKQRARALGGKVMNLKLLGGKTWQVRYTGADIDFVDNILTKVGEGLVLQAYTERGTMYGPQFPEDA